MKTAVQILFIVSWMCVGFSSHGPNAFRQPQTITLTVTITKAELILKGLSKLPYEESAETIQDITLQAQKQLSPKPVADTTKPKKQ